MLMYVERMRGCKPSELPQRYVEGVEVAWSVMCVQTVCSATNLHLALEQSYLGDQWSYISGRPWRE